MTARRYCQGALSACGPARVMLMRSRCSCASRAGAIVDDMPAPSVPRAIHPRIIHEILPVGLLQCNCSILGDCETYEALVLDPGDNVERILEALARNSLTVRAIVSTHAHIDHVGGLRKLQQETGAPVMMHGDDLDLYRHLDAQAAWLGVPAPAVAEVDQVLVEGDTVRWGPFAANVLHTPGHTPGSISLYLPGERLAHARDTHEPREATSRTANSAAGFADVTAAPAAEGTLFAGDTLFAGSIGRTDLWGGSLEDIMRSIHRKLLVLPEETSVYPGHGPATTIGEERERNPFLQRSR
jgi:hydroxyacylglutathione hydrolase